ncbi:M14 family metallocarboxypeptidase [Metabacillus sp. GX 13764]|uniref:M14 family metallopeptidase n=1 Tax=Metabacillus kandeliae TaxID=2900151 RepID=UPI001E382AA6|nr:M14 family metallocarboxypeptidase [Metabacillus kandeliae]MCD7033115.1 M14 family metallocarboxypeptidase [Metabacillus kandeliae]
MNFSVEQPIGLNELSEKLNLPVQLILDSNAEKLPGLLSPGQQVLIPGYVSDGAENVQHNKITGLMGNRKKAYDYQALLDDLALLQTAYPFIQQNIIGTTVLKKPIYEVTVGSGPKKIHMNASFHANEWITSAALMQFLETYLLALIQEASINGIPAIKLYEDTTLSIVPMVNPDGVDLVLASPSSINDAYYQDALRINSFSDDFSSWKANIRGVDLNNQFPAYWEIEKERKEPKSPAPRDYPGDQPLTEPEAKAMAALVKEKNFDRLVAFHTQGEEIYWGYMQKEPEESAVIVKEYAIQSGYKAVQDIDSHAGFRDWFINEWKRPGFTVELGIGANPLPIEQFDEICRKSEGIFWSTLYL